MGVGTHLVLLLFMPVGGKSSKLTTAEHLMKTLHFVHCFGFLDGILNGQQVLVASTTQHDTLNTGVKSGLRKLPRLVIGWMLLLRRLCYFGTLVISGFRSNWSARNKCSDSTCFGFVTICFRHSKRRKVLHKRPSLLTLGLCNSFEIKEPKLANGKE